MLIKTKQYELNAVLNKDREVPVITYPIFDQFNFITHGFSTKLGGVSEGIFSTLNLSFTRGDDEKHVRENYRRFAKSLELDENDFVFSDQVHDTKIHVITEEDRGYGVKFERKLKDIDGMITRVKNLPLVTFYADCVPLYFVDPVQKVIGLSHSGWRGTVNKMGLKTVEAMSKEFQSNPRDIVGVIGPSICRDCYEVSEDVILEVKKNFPEYVARDVLDEKPNHKYQLDLWLLNKYIMLMAGLKEENICISGVCTCCNNELLFSHRKTEGRRGNLAAVLVIKDELV